MFYSNNGQKFFCSCSMKIANAFQMITFIFILVSINFGYCYPNDASNSACMSIMPDHHIDRAQCQPKYIIEPEKYEYDPNDVIQSKT